MNVPMVSRSTNPAEKVTKVPRSRHRQNTLLFWGFVGPMVLGLLVFNYLPILWGFVLSLSQARLTLTPQRFVGLENYAYMLRSPEFIKSILNILQYSVFIVPTTFFASLGLALLVNRLRFGQGFFRSVFFIPTACSYVVASLLWKMSLFNGLPYGLVNMVLWEVGEIDPVVWIGFGELPLYWVVLVTLRLWLQVGFYMIIFLAALQEIPKEFYEAASVDGVNSSWQRFRYVTFPLIRNASVTVIILNFIGAIQAFDEFYNILSSSVSAGNLALARPPLVYLYQVAFGEQNYGRGTAGAFILTVIIITITLIQSRLLRFGQR